jgi:hypothetical protein
VLLPADGDHCVTTVYILYVQMFGFVVRNGSIEIKSKSAQTQLNSVYCTELHVSTYLRSLSGSQFVFKTF